MLSVAGFSLARSSMNARLLSGWGKGALNGGMWVSSLLQTSRKAIQISGGQAAASSFQEPPLPQRSKSRPAAPPIN